jgi:hypothetical protein
MLDDCAHGRVSNHAISKVWTDALQEIDHVTGDRKRIGQLRESTLITPAELATNVVAGCEWALAGQNGVDIPRCSRIYLMCETAGSHVIHPFSNERYDSVATQSGPRPLGDVGVFPVTTSLIGGEVVTGKIAFAWLELFRHIVVMGCLGGRNARIERVGLLTELFDVARREILSESQRYPSGCVRHRGSFLFGHSCCCRCSARTRRCPDLYVRRSTCSHNSAVR